MLTLNDGRSELWQWDTGRTLAVDADCSQVHFSNKVFGRSIDVDVIDGAAIIPDVLLQTDKDLNVWAFVGTAENGYTKISKTFKVNRRNKPADYVFTPPDQTTLAELSGRIDRIEESQDPDAIKNAVDDYLEKNPVEAPVQSVNGQIGKVELNAKDVGAISQDDLQEATNEALSQAKASGEFDGAPGADGHTPEYGVDYGTPEQIAEIAQHAAGILKPDVNQIKDNLANKLPKSPSDWEPWTADEQTVARERMGIAGYELIVDVPTLETVSNFHITLDSNGNSLALKAVTIDFAGATGGDNCLVEINNGYLRFIGALGNGRFGSFVGIPLGNDYYCYYFTNNAPDRNQPNPNSNQFMAGVKADTIINDIWFRGTVPAGASIQIYGIRG